MNKKKLLFVADTDWFFISHRLPLAVAAKEAGYAVTVLAYDTGRASEIREKGIDFIHAALVRKGLDPLKEISIIRELYGIYKHEKPDIVHHITLKIIMGGSVAAKLAGVKSIVNAVTGLGHFFIDPNRQWIVNLLFSPLFRLIKQGGRLTYIFQNLDDRAVFLDKKWADPEQTVLIKGSGVDLLEFAAMPEPVSEKIRVSCGTRLLRDKGIVEFAEAARLLKSRYQDRVEFLLAGRIIIENPTSISREEIASWEREGILTYTGFQSDMYDFLVKSHINVLPSYREGLPRSLIEACAVGRAIVTTDVAGCRDVVSHGVNGLLVPARNSEKLAEAIALLIDNKQMRLDMGRESRRRAELEFGIDKVVEGTLRVYGGSAVVSELHGSQ